MTDDITPDEALERVTTGINALFAAHREVEAHERNSYIQAQLPEALRDPREVPADVEDDGWRHYVFVAFANGIAADYETECPSIESLAQTVEDTISAVANAFPDHVTQQVVWRTPAEFSTWEAGSYVIDHRRYRWRAGRKIYVRLVATPLGV